MDQEHTDRQYDTELQQLATLILRMAAKVEEMISGSVEALRYQRLDQARSVIESDRQVNHLEVDIDEACLYLLARRQPMASDLRFITTAMKLVTDLERIGDLAVNVCERVIELGLDPPLRPYVDFDTMSQAVREMVSDAMDAFVTRDAARAEQVTQRDKKIDAYYEQTFRELLTYMMEDPRKIQAATKLQSIGKHLERMGDHATNLAEEVIFMVKGSDIRHRGKLATPETDELPRGVLFVSVHNAARSQMAEGWARQLFPIGVRVASAGLEPTRGVNRFAVRVMKEVGIDIASRQPKSLDRVALNEVDVVVNLSDEKIHLVSDHIKLESWPTPDPTATARDERDVLDEFRKVRDELRARIEEMALSWAGISRFGSGELRESSPEGRPEQHGPSTFPH
jgi:phosphate transport system protein